MNPWINYHHLLYFKTIAEEESVSKAAQKLRLGQPTLSAQLKQFEENMNVVLFDRQHKKLILTEQGRIALDYARQIFKIGQEMYEVLQDRITPSRIHLKIGALDNIPKELILALAKTAYAIEPCQISLVEGPIDEMIRELSAHRVDLIVTNHMPASKETRGLVHRTLAKQNVSLFGAPSFKNLKKGFPQTLSGQKFVLPTFDSKLRYDIEHWAHLNEIQMDIIAETQDTSLTKLLAIDGLGLIAAAPATISRHLQNQELTELGSLKGVFDEIFLISAPRKVANPLAAKLMKNFTMS